MPTSNWNILMIVGIGIFQLYIKYGFMFWSY